MRELLLTTLFVATCVVCLGYRYGPTAAEEAVLLRTSDYVDAIAIGDIAFAHAALDRGADPNQRSERGYTPLMWAADQGAMPLVDRLLSLGADPSALSDRGMSALAMAADNAPIVERLIGAGANIDEVIFLGGTALHHAAGSGYVTSALALLRHGARVDLLDEAGATPLLIAIRRGDVPVELVRAMLNAGADPDATDRRGESPRSAAREEGRADLERLFAETKRQRSAPAGVATGSMSSSTSGSASHPMSLVGCPRSAGRL